MSLFICPLCQSPLLLAADTWRCDGSLHPKKTVHTFDVARQGYVNLLPVQQKNSKTPGDSAASIMARQRFLQAGFYQPLQTLICEQIDLWLSKKRLSDQLLSAHKDDNDSINWLDIGCGEGYYTGAMAQTAVDELIAADISKPAVIALAKVSKANHQLWYQSGIAGQTTAAIYPIVTSAAHLPLRANSISGISSIFSPILPQAFAEVLADKGYLLIAKPDVRHLASVREALFDEVREHDSDKFLTELAPYFELRETHVVTTELSLAAEPLADLLTMTPYSYRAHASRREALLAMSQDTPFMTEAKFVVYVLQKRVSATDRLDA